MKFNNTTIIQGAVFLAALLLTACGGGSGGSSGSSGSGGSDGGATPPPPPPPPALLATGTFTKSFAPKGTNGTGFPFGNAVKGVINQNLYLASEINGAGNITTLRFLRYDGNAPVTCPNTTIKLGHTNLTELTPIFANNVQSGQGSQVTVLHDTTLTIPEGVGGTWFDIPLTTPFAYNGKDNLVVQIDHATGCSTTVAVSIIAADMGRAAVAYYNETSVRTLAADQPLMQFVFAGGDNKQDYGGEDSNSSPFGNLGTRTQNLYLYTDINGSGPVTGIGFHMRAASVAAGTYTYSLKLGHSKLKALTTNYASNYSDTPVTVANAVTFTIPAGVPAGEWVWVPIPTGVFSYNGTENLIVEVATTSGTVDNYLSTAPIPDRRVYAASADATTGRVDDSEYHIALRFHGGGMSKLSAGNDRSDSIFNGAFSSATLYSATDLGTAGSITSVSCHLYSPSTAASYANFKVVMGYATAATLSGTAATDFVSQNTVFDGTVTVPAGLSAGDWIDIPLTTPFAYDGKSNLIVWMGNNGTASGTPVANGCRSDSAARYTGGFGYSTAGVGSPTYHVDYGMTTDIRMAVQK